MTVKEILKDLVAINTIKDKENKAFMDYIENFVKPLGFDVDRRLNPETGKEVLVATFGDNPTIGFLGHTDTVDVTEGWTYDPFNLTEEDGKLYGLGTCDMKGGIAAALYAAANAPLDEIKAAGKGIKMYWTYDEEIMFGGIRDLVASGEQFPAHVVVCEPTDNMPEIGSKGILEYIFTGNKSQTSSVIKVAVYSTHVIYNSYSTSCARSDGARIITHKDQFNTCTWWICIFHSLNKISVNIHWITSLITIRLYH